tara:strand:+ start:1887 stop:2138 length:252 start_codon:yes stop_codon:yes gene_type:complete
MAKAKKQITEEQLKTVKDQQAKLNGLLRSLGVLDLQKENIRVEVNKVSKEIDSTKKELEDEYGQVNIDLQDGSYTDIEKEDGK